ncbi:hypothetical protein [Aquimarina longa]|uniref:hypothetical protein n=1 Tax=Aquimarina longa TaxID=1080221 RepID=UPI000A807EB3|nr:hypothetical protein [Aquimarina longa]
MLHFLESRYTPFALTQSLPLYLALSKTSSMGTYIEQHKSKYISDILQALHHKVDTFMYNLVQYSPYEIILYTWINKLYTKGKTTDDAIQLIYKARNILLLNSQRGLCSSPDPL